MTDIFLTFSLQCEMKCRGSGISIERMGNSAATSCLSAEDHDDAIKDPLVHYFGCLQFCDRDDLLSPNHKIWAIEKAHQIKLETTRKPPQTSETEIEKEAKKNLDAIRDRWKESFEKELRRIELLRKTLEEDKEDAVANLVREVNACCQTWRSSVISKKSFTQIPITSAASSATIANSNSSYDNYVVEEDVSVGII